MNWHLLGDLTLKLSIRRCAELAYNSYDWNVDAAGGNIRSDIGAYLNVGGAQALIMRDGVMLIPGSNEFSDWLKNFNVLNILGRKFNATDASKSGSGAMFHAGFWHHTQQIHAFAKDNNARFIIGHSLGAAAAQILGVALDIPAVGFASPRVKRGKHKVRYEDKILNICRADDLVTHMPPSDTGFRRLGTTYNLISPTINKGIDHRMIDYIGALDFDAFEGKLPNKWG